MCDIGGMSDRIHEGEGLATALARIAGEEMDGALKELERKDAGEATHNVRKTLKRLRALLRALRLALPETTYREENGRLRAAAHMISPLRDAHVLQQTLRELPGAKSEAGRTMRREWKRRQEDLGRQTPKLRRSLREILRDERGRLAVLPYELATPEKLSSGLKKVYKQGRNRFKTARRRPTPENLHEWRKKVKALGYAIELLEELASKKVEKAGARCEELGDALGDDHDLFMLLEALRGERRERPKIEDNGLADDIAKEREKLQREALKLGRRIYRDKPGEFAARVNKIVGPAKTA